MPQNSNTAQHREQLSQIETGEDFVNYLYQKSGLGYERITNFESSGIAAADWDAFALRNENSDTILTYIELSAAEDTTSLSEVKRHFKRYGREDSELFAVVAKRATEGTHLQTKIENQVTVIRVEDRLSSGEVDLDFDLRLFELTLDEVEPFYLDFLDDLSVSSGEDLTTLQNRITETFSLKAVTSRFYKEFGEIFQDTLQPAINGLDTNGIDVGSYAQLVVNRILFLMFVQQKGWLNRNTSYVQDMYEDAKDDGQKDVYTDLFQPLFFDALNNPDTHEFDYLGTIPYFNGGLFEKRAYESDVTIDEEFFDALLDPTEDPETHEPKGYLRRYKISLSESNPSEQQLVVDPEFIGRIFEMFMQAEERSDKGAFYTPKPITQYMAKNALKHYLFEDFDKYESEIIQLIADHEVSGTLESNIIQAIKSKLDSVRILDPAVGSGAFIIAMIEELVGITQSLNGKLDEDKSSYELKERYVANSLYGVDIDRGGIELCKFRVWLHLMQDLPANLDAFLESNHDHALPNLGMKFFVGNSLVGDFEPTTVGETLSSDEGYQGSLDGNFDEKSLTTRIAQLRKEFFGAHGDEKDSIESELDRLTQTLDGKVSWEKSDHWMPEVVAEIDPEDVFKWSIQIPEVMLDDERPGFDIVIANPPYKGGEPDYIIELSKFYHEHRDEYVKPVRSMRHDLYQKFIYRAEELTRANGILTMITSSTFRTIATKTASRNLLQKNRLEELFITNSDTFDAAVDAAIFTLRHKDMTSQNYELLYVNGQEAPINIYRDLINSQPLTRDDVGDSEAIQLVETIHDIPSYRIPIQVYRNCLRKTFFEPSEDNQDIYYRYIKPVQELFEKWQDELLDINSQRKNLDEIYDEHIDKLEIGNVTLLGLVTWGGQGLIAVDNKEHIAYIDGTYEANKIKERNGGDFVYIDQNEEEFRWINRVIKTEHTVDSRELSDEEKRNGIDSDERNGQTWVPIEKGSSIEDIYFKPTIEYIDWSKDSIQKIKDRKYGRLRDTDLYFREGIFASRGGTGEYKSKARYIDNSVVDSSGTVMIPTTEKLPAKYLLGILNSNVMKYIVDNFINSTVNVQVGDMRLLPIPVPNEDERTNIIGLVDEAIAVQKGEITGEVETVHSEIEKKVKRLYDLDVDYEAT